LLDEPFAGVDPIAVLDIQKIIRFLKERASASSSRTITCGNAGICDHAYIINDGLVLAFGNPTRSSIMKTYDAFISAKIQVVGTTLPAIHPGFPFWPV